MHLGHTGRDFSHAVYANLSQISIEEGPGDFTIPYTVIPISFTSCGHGSAGIFSFALLGLFTYISTHFIYYIYQPWLFTNLSFSLCPGIDCPTAPPNLDLCQSMGSISDQLNINLVLEDTAHQCSPLSSCREVTCNFGGGQFSIALSCSPVGITLAYNVATDSSPPQTQSQVFTESGVSDSNMVTVDTTSEGVIRFALTDIQDSPYPLVKDTFIPTTSCDEQPTGGGEFVFTSGRSQLTQWGLEHMLY